MNVIRSSRISRPVRWTEFPDHRIRAGVAVLTRPPPGHAEPCAAPMAVVAAVLWLLVGAVGTVHAEPPSAPATDQSAESVWATQQSDPGTVALGQAERRYHLPPGLLVSIARAESGRPIASFADIRPWPWTIDADGTGLFLDSKAAAIAWGMASRRRTTASSMLAACRSAIRN